MSLHFRLQLLRVTQRSCNESALNFLSNFWIFVIVIHVGSHIYVWFFLAFFVPQNTCFIIKYRRWYLIMAVGMSLKFGFSAQLPVYIAFSVGTVSMKDKGSLFYPQWDKNNISNLTSPSKCLIYLRWVIILLHVQFYWGDEKN